LCVAVCTRIRIGLAVDGGLRATLQDLSEESQAQPVDGSPPSVRVQPVSDLMMVENFR
jgi:hypothetical protein